MPGAEWDDLAWDPHPLPRPAIFTIKDSLLDGHFVLATLSDTDSQSQDLGSPERHQPVPQLQAHR